MIDVYVKTFNIQTYFQNVYESATFKIKNYSPHDLIFQHLPVKEKVKNMETNKMRNGYVIDVLTGVDIQELVKIVGKVNQTYKSIIYWRNF